VPDVLPCFGATRRPYLLSRAAPVAAHRQSRITQSLPTHGLTF